MSRTDKSLATLCALVLSLGAAQIGCSSDPCDGGDGACLTVEVHGPMSGVEKVQVDLSGAVDFRVTKEMPAGTSTLPVQLGVLLPDVAGTVTVRVVALAGTSPLGAGKQDVTVAAGSKTRVIVELAALASPGCSDGFRDGTETDVDCGGACPACKPGQRCAAPADCGADLCSAAGKCVAASCSDGKTDGDETDVDCGGACGKCADTRACKAPGDCASGVCTGNKCIAASCGDGVRNGGETDVDCGGACSGCATGKACNKASDCLSGRCDANNKCAGVTFALGAPLAYSVSGAVTSVVAGDLNGDGFADLVTTSNAGLVTVLVSRGAFSYVLAATYMAGSYGALGNRINAIGDMNGDGKLDVAVLGAFPGSAGVSVFFGRGDGTLQAAVTVALTANSIPTGLALIDHNGDGALDLAVSESTPGQVEIRLYDKMGGFPPAGMVLVPAPGAVAVIAGDWNADGRTDLAVSTAVAMAMPPNRIVLYLADARGNLVAGPAAGLPGGATLLTALDLNGDGAADLAAGGGAIYTLLGRPKDAMVLFDAAVTTSTPQTVLSLSGGDLNGDGKADLLASINGAASGSLYPGKGDGSLGAVLPVGLPGSATSSLAADLDGDKKPDITAAVGNQVILYPNDGAGSYAVARSVPIANAGQPRNSLLADVNGDGKLDLLAAAAKGVAVSLGAGDGTFMANTVEAVAMNVNGLVARDWNGDGKLDVAVTSSSANVVTVASGNGDGTFGAPVSTPVGTRPVGLAAGDLNSDGKLDLVVANNGSSDVSVLLGSGGGFAMATNVAVGGGPTAVAAADVTGDGNLDVLVTVNNSLVVLPGNGAGSFGASSSTTVGTSPSAIATADLNRDGKLDVVVANTSSQNVSVLIAAGGGAGGFLAAINYAVLLAPGSLAVADLNLDGRPDIVSGSLTTNTLSVLLGAGDAGGTLLPSLNYLTGTYPFVAAGDLNGDGKADIVTSNAGTTNLTVLANASR